MNTSRMKAIAAVVDFFDGKSVSVKHAKESTMQDIVKRTTRHLLIKLAFITALCALLTTPAVPLAAIAAGKLPAGYTEVEYIQGNGSSRIVTDYTPNPQKDKVEAVVNFTAKTFHQAVWCARDSGSADTWTLFMFKLSDDRYQFRFDYGTVGSQYPNFNVSTNTKYTITAEGNTITYAVDGSQLDRNEGNAPDLTVGSPMALFASHSSGMSNPGNYGSFKLYSFKVWRSGELIHYFVPCKDLSNDATLVDICENPATLTKTGTFIPGSEGHYFSWRTGGTIIIVR